MPTGFPAFPVCYPEDAEAQIQKAVALYWELFGKNRRGCGHPRGRWRRS